MKKVIEKKKNKKLLLQIGLITFLYSLFMIVIVSKLMYAVGIDAHVHAKQDQLMETLKRMDANLFGDQDGVYFLSGNILDYIEAHPDVISKRMRITDYDYEEEGWDEFYKDYMEWTDAGRSRDDFFRELPEKYMTYASWDIYFSLWYSLIEEQHDYSYRELALLDISDGKTARVLFYANEDSDVNIMDYYNDGAAFMDKFEKKYHFGSEWEDLKDHPMLQNMIKGKSREPFIETDWRADGDENIRGYYPVLIDGKLRCVLMVSLEWAEFQDRMVARSARLSWIAALVIMISELLLLLYVNLAAVKPLSRVKDSLNRYIKTKDSEAVVSEMGEIGQRNEFGLLADDISSMVREIDRYTKENMELAGERERASAELGLASSIQNGMLRHSFPDTAEYAISALMDPAKEVGGDFYDFFEVDETHIALTIADVAGKGVPGALYMMSVLSVLRGKTQPGKKPSEILADINSVLVKGDFGDMFVTVWLGIVDLETGIITAANAGHEYPFIKKEDSFEMLKDRHGFVLGGIEGVKFSDYEIDLSNGGTIIVYTDGVPEATAASEEMYGTDRILEILNRSKDAGPDELADNIKKDVDLFVGDAEQFDDLTILCFEFKKNKVILN